MKMTFQDIRIQSCFQEQPWDIFYIFDVFLLGFRKNNYVVYVDFPFSFFDMSLSIPFWEGFVDKVLEYTVGPCETKWRHQVFVEPFWGL